MADVPSMSVTEMAKLPMSSGVGIGGDAVDHPECFMLRFPSQEALRSGALKLKPLLEPVEKALLEDALRKMGGSREKTARAFGLHRATLFAKLRKHGIH